MDKIKDLYKKYIVLDKKWGVVSGCLFLLFLIFWKSLPRNFPTFKGDTMIMFLLDCFLCVTLFARVRLSEHYDRVFCWLLLIIAPALCLINTEEAVGNQIRKMTFLMVVLNYALYLMAFLVLYLLTNRVQIAVCLGMSVFTIYALTNSFITEFRGNGIRTADIYAWKTAFNVSGRYSLVFTHQRGYIILVAFAVILLGLRCDYRQKNVKRRIQTAAVTLCYLVLMYSIFWDNEFMTENAVKPYLWELTESAKNHGGVLEFAAGIPGLKVEKPISYSSAKAQELKQEGASEDSRLNVHTKLNGKKPDIIVIMNESFSDLRQVGNFDTDTEYLDYFNSLQDNVIRGYTSVPVFGGLTANTEFEFMTGFSNAFFPAGIMPYQNYVKDNTPSLREQLFSQGYYSIFMHPMNSNGWNRKNVYQALKFDEAYYIEDWENPEMLRGAVSDSGDYKDVISRYEKAKKENDNVFLFNVTMQNHGGYVDGSYESTVHITDLEGNYPLTEQYLSLIRESDNAFKELVTYFSQKENPVLICMFGDHQPSVEDEFFNEIQQASEDSDIVKLAKKYQTPYILYSNYEMEGQQIDNLSVNYLQVLLMEAAGLPLNDYQKYLENLYKIYPVINVNGVMDREGKWHSWDEAQNFKEIQDYSIVQYKELFDR
ncbi:LTA synthase family protein [Muricomes intestini]|uniref:LTA synthase family protein n=1 Tax=Muricomes intestini TaxID=1796634 RepID=UPI0014049711|nr:LTA synthase family protein [Muricomes intestini]